MSNSTTFLKMALMSAFQTNKEVIFNEAMQIIDVILSPCIEEIVDNEPKKDPIPNEKYLFYLDGFARVYYSIPGDTKWRFITPLAGSLFWVQKPKRYFMFDGYKLLPLAFVTDEESIKAQQKKNKYY